MDGDKKDRQKSLQNLASSNEQNGAIQIPSLNTMQLVTFERVSQISRRTKEGTFIYSKTLTNCTGKRIPTAVNW